MSKIERAQRNFDRFVRAWASAEQECSCAYVTWQRACRAREQAAMEKNNAWGELEMARAEASPHPNGERRGPD